MTNTQGLLMIHGVQFACIDWMVWQAKKDERAYRKALRERQPKVKGDR